MKGRSLFPIGLHASILVALLCLFNPWTSSCLEGWGGTVMSLPLRTLAVVLPRPAEAYETARSPSLASEKVDVLRARQLRMHSQIPNAIDAFGDLRLVLCQVIERQPATARWPDVLTLDRSWADLFGCERFVTSGDTLLGFLADPEPGESLAAPARIHLLNHRRRGRMPRRVAAQVRLNAEERLRFLVEPASEIDQWPLRCALLDDPYLAAGVQRTDLEVLTIEVDDPLGSVPAGLNVGRMRPWGYERSGGGFTPIDLYVQPGVHSQFVSMVDLWRDDAAKTSAPTSPLGGGRIWVGRLIELPAPRPGIEWYVTLRWDAPIFRPGAALLDGERLIGRVASAGPGHVFARPFGQPGREWVVTMLPDLVAAPPVDLRVISEGRSATQSRLRVLQGELSGLSGDLFTGAMSEDCPPGLWIGPVQAVASTGADQILVVTHGRPDRSSHLGIFERLEVLR